VEKDGVLGRRGFPQPALVSTFPSASTTFVIAMGFE